ncbi:MAG: DUF4931 domain-containing protein [bacterium]|nr:DUF4931 domain-containing protein [bacterium]
MSKYVPDIMSSRWVIMSTHRVERPEDVHSKTKKNICIFCEGNESYSPSEVYRKGKGEANTKGWEVRVVSNKYPITDFHEVIIHSPKHNEDIDTLSLPHITQLFKTYKERFNFYKSKGQVMIFCNHGDRSGASLTHPHSQLVVIPSQINLDTLTREPLENIVETNTFFQIYCPDFSQWPYEVWIAPKKEGTFFGDIPDNELEDLAMLMQKTLRNLKKIAEKQQLSKDEFAYNFYIYPKHNWYLRIIPRLVHRAGFELGTGLSVNVIDPTVAAQELRSIEEKINHVLKKLKKF